ncbi:universal stress protein [Microbacterium luticocti]|uniref:universal stress protein n=1 Tax=Microbacterium luticocti TaxID=451764 RepID=UPI0003FB18B3|nr:universal stress protein [Microbacterium luticocti]
MTVRILVGYTATTAGADAVALGARLAHAVGAVLELVLVLPGDERSVITPTSPGYDRYLRDQATQWLTAAADAVPAGVDVHTHVRYGDSVAAGLSETADRMRASLIVLGTAGGGPRGRHRLGSVAAALLHSAAVPVLLAPKGERKSMVTGIPRITVATGARAGAKPLLAAAADLAAATGAPLRLVSLVAVDLPSSVDTGAIRLAGTAHADDVLAQVRAALGDGGVAEAVIADGESIDDAVNGLDWQPGELVMVGSSRLARKHRLFLGATAAKMLRSLPVPMIVVPRKPKGVARFTAARTAAPKDARP